jgi:hypothetical protein
MQQSDDLVALRNEVLRKVGRNVVNFQKVEACLRFLIVVSDSQGTSDTLLAHQKKRTKKIRKLSLGMLSTVFFDDIYGAEPERTEPVDVTKLSISTTFRVEADQATIKRQKRTLSALVAERNRLIHKDLASFDHNSRVSCSTLIETMDVQNGRILQQLDELRHLVEAYKGQIAALKSWMDAGGIELLLHKGSNDA